MRRDSSMNGMFGGHGGIGVDNTSGSGVNKGSSLDGSYSLNFSRTGSYGCNHISCNRCGGGSNGEVSGVDGWRSRFSIIGDDGVEAMLGIGSISDPSEATIGL